MTNIDHLLDRNRVFAGTDARQNVPALPFLPRQAERTLAETPALDPARTVRTDVQRVLWAPEIPPNVQVSGHVYDVETGLVTTVIDAKASRQPA
jgi:carbonic anhydrase